jgi:hypothetical protein
MSPVGTKLPIYVCSSVANTKKKWPLRGHFFLVLARAVMMTFLVPTAMKAAIVVLLYNDHFLMAPIVPRVS